MHTWSQSCQWSFSDLSHIVEAASPPTQVIKGSILSTIRLQSIAIHPTNCGTLPFQSIQSNGAVIHLIPRQMAALGQMLHTPEFTVSLHWLWRSWSWAQMVAAFGCHESLPPQHLLGRVHLSHPREQTGNVALEDACVEGKAWNILQQ